MVTVSLEQFLFDYKELAVLLIKARNIHEGHWHILLNFAMQATLMPMGVDERECYPAAVVPVVSIGIMRSGEPNPLTVDAAKVNPG